MEKDAQAKLIETATPLFAKKGFSAVSIRELAQTADVNSALISYYFGSKEGLYQAVLEEQFFSVSQMLERFKEKEYMSPLERLRLYGKSVIIVHQHSPFLIRFMTSELTNPTTCYETVIKKYIYQIFNLIRTAIKEGIANGDFKSELNLEYTTVSLAGIINFFFIAKPIFKDFAVLPEQANEEYVTQALEVFLNGIIRR